MFFEKSENPKIGEKKSLFREKMKVLEFSADHFGYGTVKIREISCFSKNPENVVLSTVLYVRREGCKSFFALK